MYIRTVVSFCQVLALSNSIDKSRDRLVDVDVSDPLAVSNEAPFSVDRENAKCHSIVRHRYRVRLCRFDRESRVSSIQGSLCQS